MTDVVGSPPTSWILYDGECSLCTAWANRFTPFLMRHGFSLAPLQEQDLEKPPTEMRVVLADGSSFGGADALLSIARRTIWGWPLVLCALLPGVKPLLRAGYRRLAANRHCFNGACTVKHGAVSPRFSPSSIGKTSTEWMPEQGTKAPEDRRSPKPVGIPRTLPRTARFWTAPVLWRFFRETGPHLYRSAKRHANRFSLFRDRLPLITLVSLAALTRSYLPAWVFMWVIAGSVFFGFKWISLRHALERGSNLSAMQTIAYLLAWPGMDARRFGSPSSRGSVPTSHWLGGLLRTSVGTAVFIFAVRSPALPGLARGWLGMLGIILALHFGLFELLASVWRKTGIAIKPVMQQPLRSRCLADFWGNRWNTAFSHVAHVVIFKPMARNSGIKAATIAVFLFSGIIHELVISFPARGGYGWPTLYFVLQGLAVLFERSTAGRILGFGRANLGRLFALAIAGIPAFWLFHPQFIQNVILPMLNAFGSM